MLWLINSFVVNDSTSSTEGVENKGSNILCIKDVNTAKEKTPTEKTRKCENKKYVKHTMFYFCAQPPANISSFPLTFAKHKKKEGQIRREELVVSSSSRRKKTLGEETAAENLNLTGESGCGEG